MPEHNIAPIYDEQSKILILGSFPSVKSREAEFFYGHPQNRFWQVLERVFDAPGALVGKTPEEKTTFLKSHHIAVWDVIESCTITGSSDATIRDVVPNDFDRILKTAQIRQIYCNGSTAGKLFRKYCGELPERLFRTMVILPSTSPANAAWSVENLTGAWGRIRTVLQRKEFKDYYSLRNYLTDTYGERYYKLALDGGFTCPNRDGTLGERGCIFCDGEGSGHFSGNSSQTIDEQIAFGKELLAPKLKGKIAGYIAYFQAFTGTYAPIEELRARYEEALSNADVSILSIATRPDCLSKEVLQLLKECNEKKPVWIELGLQTSDEKTAKYIRRGYELSVYKKAVKDLQQIGIRQIITHVILGLPGETTETMKRTVACAVEAGTTGVKLQLLHVLKGTDLATEFEAGVFETLEPEDYVELLEELVFLLPADVVVHRLTGDGEKAKLIAPLWSADKKRVLGMISGRIEG